MTEGMQAGKEGSMDGQCPTADGERFFEQCTFRGKGIEMWCGGARIAIAGEVGYPDAIHNDQDEIRLPVHDVPVSWLTNNRRNPGELDWSIEIRNRFT